MVESHITYHISHGRIKYKAHQVRDDMFVAVSAALFNQEATGNLRCVFKLALWALNNLKLGGVFKLGLLAF